MSAVTSLSRNDPTVDPGGQSAITIKIRNSGSIVDRFDVDVVGPSTGWAHVDPPSLSLFPGVEGSVTITFTPPRASTPRAGVYPFGIRVRPAADPAGSTVEEGRISVTPFTTVAADIVPQTSRGSKVGRHQVIVVNRGNAPSDVSVTAEDPDRRLKLAVQPARSVVAPDARIEFGIRVEVDDPFPFGADRRRPFQVKVEPGRQAPIALGGTLLQRPMLPGWIPPVAGVVGIVALLGVGAFLVKAGPFAEAPSPTPIAQVSAPPSAEPSATPTAAPSEPPPSAASEVPSAPPSVPPSPTSPQNEIRFEGFELEDNGLRSEPSPAAQRQPLITFKTVGPGNVVLDVTDYQGGDPNTPTRVCLVPDGGDRSCEDITGPTTITAPNEEAAERSWQAFARPRGDGSAPTLKLTLTFFATTPSVSWTDNTSIFGSAGDAIPGFAGFNAIIRGPNPQGLLTARTTFTSTASWAFGSGDLSQPPIGLTQITDQITNEVSNVPLPVGGFLEYRHVVLNTFDGLPTTYTVTFSWQ